MNSKRFAVVASLIFALIFAFGAPWQMQAQDNKTPYPSMAPLNQYLMQDRNAEIALARSAAPASISDDAKVMVLGPHGYETAAEGKNGFVCIVERSWMSPYNHPQFWNPKNRSATCYNPPGARSVLPITLRTTELALAGKSKAEIKEAINNALAKKELPALEAGAMAYMMAKDTYLTDPGGNNLAHVMFLASSADGAALGAGLPGSPLILFKGPGEVNVIIVGTGMWSDGTPAPILAAPKAAPK
jgi:hypothetical protein